MKNILGQRLKELRGKMSLREAAKLTGVSHGYLDRLEKGIDPRTGKEIMPSASTLKALARAYNCNYEELLHLAGYLEDNSIRDAVATDYERTDPEMAELIAKVKEKGATLEATTLLRAVAEDRMTKSKLRALLQALDMIEEDDD